MNRFNSILAIACLAITFTACKKNNEEPTIILPPSDGSSLTLEGKTETSNYTNIVFVDFSANKQTKVDRKSWNLAFTSDSKFRVVLNAAYQTTAVVTNKTALNEVTLADPGTTVDLNHDIMDPKTVSLVDSWDGDITKTAFAEEVNITDASNKVYLLSFEGNKEKEKWFKIKVTRSGTGYKVQYARLGETVFKTLDVAKAPNYNLTFVSLENSKIVAVEPEKNNWDISWSYTTYNSGLGSPYWIQDFISLNTLNSVGAAQISTTVKTYAAFGEADLANVVFSSAKDVIGTKWRTSPNQAGVGGGVKTDVFYILKDSSGNIYKLKFNSYISGDGGERGKPVVEYKLIKKG